MIFPMVPSVAPETFYIFKKPQYEFLSQLMSTGGRATGVIRALYRGGAWQAAGAAAGSATAIAHAWHGMA